MPTIEDLKRNCNVTDEQLSQYIDIHDSGELAQYFDNVDNYLDVLGLAPGVKTDIRQIAHDSTVQGMRKALKYMIDKNPFITFRKLIEIVLNQGDGMIARNICRYVSKKCR